MKFLLCSFVLLLTVSATADELPAPLNQSDYIDAQAELERLGPIDGVWEGNLTIVEDTVGANRAYPDGYPIRIGIQGEEIGLWFIEDGDRLEAFPGEGWLVYAVDGSGLIDYVAGNDAFTETWSIQMSQVEPDKMEVHILRTVHNHAVRRDSPWRVFTVYSKSMMTRLP